MFYCYISLAWRIRHLVSSRFMTFELGDVYKPSLFTVMAGNYSLFYWDSLENHLYNEMKREELKAPMSPSTKGKTIDHSNN